MVAPLLAAGIFGGISFLSGLQKGRIGEQQRQEENRRAKEQKDINRAIAFSNYAKMPAPTRKATAPLIMQMLQIDPSSPAGKTFTQVSTSEDIKNQEALRGLAQQWSGDPNLIDSYVQLMQDDPAEFINTMSSVSYREAKTRLESLKAQSTVAVNKANINQSNASAAASRASAAATQSRLPGQVAGTEALAAQRQQKAVLMSVASGAKVGAKILEAVNLKVDLTADEAKELLKLNSGGGGVSLFDIANQGPSSSRGSGSLSGATPSTSPNSVTEQLDSSEDAIDAEIRRLEKELLPGL